MPQLDTLRFFAVLLVLGEHWVPKFAERVKFVDGGTGVLFFFVLSGYLITEILITSKLKAKEEEVSGLHVIKQFIIRRSLRIFPVYYAFLFILFFLPVIGDGIKNNFGWYLFYLNNFKIYLSQDWGAIGHTWSLAVEEQFYLFWPWIMLFTPAKHLLKVIILFIGIGVCSRELYYIANYKLDLQGFGPVITPLRFDAFGLGALLAYQNIIGIADPKKVKRWAYYSFSILAALWFIIVMLKMEDIRWYTSEIILALISLCIICLASTGFRGFLQKLLENPILLYLGRISYGIYLFHYIIPEIYKIFLQPHLPPLAYSLRLTLFFCTVIALASLSWHFFELPINNLKKRFNYTSSKRVKVLEVEKHPVELKQEAPAKG
jgi:peptidoglycan/LPS O-acetylase OafA/YrhL